MAERTVTVVGYGTASAAPDTALLHLGVETRGATPAEALDSCGRALDDVLAALRGEGVEPAGLATSGLDVHPDWEAEQRGRRPAGYQATAGLTARLAGPARAGRVAAAAVAAGGEAARVHGLALVVGDQAGVLAVARAAAWRDARARAEQYAELAGAALGEVQRIEESVGVPPGPRPHEYRAMAAAVPAGPPVEPGEATVSAAVTVTWALADGPA
jgi:uncharacterized protein